MSNSSGSIERFMLGLNDFKEYETLAPGSNTWVIDIQNTLNQGIDGTMASGGNASAIVALQTGEAAAAVTATLTTALAGTNNDLVFTATSAGVAGNSTTIAYSDPGGVTATASISVIGTNIIISLGRAASAINTTAAGIKTLIDGFAPAAALVTVANAASNDGTGLVIALAATPLASGANASVTYSTVGSPVTVVVGGLASLTGATGRFAKVLNTGSGLATVVAKPLHRIQTRVSL